MVKIENLSFEISGKTLVNNINSNFEKGKMHLILGPNGAGKSTLIKLISGELKPTKGSVEIEGINLQMISYKERAKFRAVLSQNIELSFPLSVHEVVLMGRYPHVDVKPGELDMRICEDAMNLFNVYEMKDRNYLTLSGGEKQRVQFARVFAQIWNSVEGRSRLLLLDEPLTFLDIFYQYDLMVKVKDFMKHNADITVIGVVHDINITAKFSDMVLLLLNSSIYKYGSPKDVLSKENIFEVFKVEVENTFQVK